MRSVSIVLLLFCFWTPTGSVDGGEPLKVMSFNIRYGTANDGDNHWRLRKELVVATIKNDAPDLLGTQETIKFQADFLAEKLEDYARVGWSRESDPNKGEQCTIFYKKSRFEKIKAGQFWLSETPEKAASKSWDSSLPRIATWIRLKDKKNDSEFVFLNTHFDHRGPKARLESAKLIAVKLAEFKSPCIVTGDFNCNEGSSPYNALLKSEEIKLMDSLRVFQPTKQKNEGTFNGFRGTKTGARIDWILHTSRFKTESAKIDFYNQDGRYPSDHCPVTAKLELN